MSEGFEDEGLMEHLKKKIKIKRCMALTKFSRRCRNRVSGDKDFCEVHLVKLFGDSLDSSNDSDDNHIEDEQQHFIHIYDMKKNPIVIDDSFEKLLIHSYDDRDVISSDKIKKPISPLGGCGIDIQKDSDNEIDSDNEKIHQKYKQYHEDLEEIDDIEHKDSKEEEYEHISIFDYIEKMRKEELSQQILMFEHFEKLRIEKEKEKIKPIECDKDSDLYLESFQKYGGGVIGTEIMNKALKDGELPKKFLPILQNCHPDYSSINVYETYEHIKKQYLQQFSFAGKFASIA